jgi:hypothetical protein
MHRTSLALRLVSFSAACVTTLALLVGVDTMAAAPAAAAWMAKAPVTAPNI